MKKPEVKPGDWITINKKDCVVKVVYDEKNPFGVGMIVCNPDKPTTLEFDWDGNNWFFPEGQDYGGYARNTDPFVQKLQRGRHS